MTRILSQAPVGHKNYCVQRELSYYWSLKISSPLTFSPTFRSCYDLRNEGTPILWIAVSPNAVATSEISRRYQELNDPSRPLNSLPPPALNRELLRIATEVRQVVLGSESGAPADSSNFVMKHGSDKKAFEILEAAKGTLDPAPEQASQSEHTPDANNGIIISGPADSSVLVGATLTGADLSGTDLSSSRDTQSVIVPVFFGTDRKRLDCGSPW